jgi:hypothetical protein
MQKDGGLCATGLDRTAEYALTSSYENTRVVSQDMIKPPKEELAPWREAQKEVLLQGYNGKSAPPLGSANEDGHGACEDAVAGADKVCFCERHVVMWTLWWW